MTAIPASTCYTQEMARRGLTIPTDLDDELRQACLAPRTNERALMARLQHGCQVMERYEGARTAIPDHLWARWEAILVAWLCCRDELEGGKGRTVHRRRTMERS